MQANQENTTIIIVTNEIGMGLHDIQQLEENLPNFKVG
jgi:adenosyl cobinamide kinase/adenosyl cobinamide phosphate guanylyltransferase